jgi:ATP-dependent RNA helicase MSS116
MVGTPGRLKDILSDPYSGVAAPKLDCFVLDEADRLLDAGFWPEIEAMQKLLPPRSVKDRQTLMFSATIPREVIHIVRSTLKRGYQFVKCVQDNEAPTVARVPQKLVKVVGLENALPTLYELAQREIQAAHEDTPFKAIVFFPSTAEVTLAADVFRNLSGEDGKHPLHPTRTIEIHAKLTQGQRTNSADTFKRSKSAILFSSDVTARGMDFPGVTHVIQVGQPANRDTYIHRIGRTGRAGKEGEAWLILTELELREAKTRLRDLPITHDDTLHAPKVDMSAPAQVPAHVAAILTDIGKALKRVDYGAMGKVYLALLGIYQWVPQKRTLIEAMNRLARYGWGLEKPPGIPAGLARRLNISNVPGVNISSGFDADDAGGSSRGGDRGGFGGRGGGSRGGFGGDRGGDRGGFGGGDRPPRRDFGDRGGSSRGGFGDRGGSSRGGFGDRGGSSRGGGFGDRGGSSSGRGYQGRNDGGYGGRSSEGRSPGGYGGDRR